MIIQDWLSATVFFHSVLLGALIAGAGVTEKKKRKRQGPISLFVGFGLFVGMTLGMLLVQRVINYYAAGLITEAVSNSEAILIIVNIALVIFEFYCYYKWIE